MTFKFKIEGGIHPQLSYYPKTDWSSMDACC